MDTGEYILVIEYRKVNRRRCVSIYDINILSPAVSHALDILIYTSDCMQLPLTEGVTRTFRCEIEKT